MTLRHIPIHETNVIPLPTALRRSQDGKTLNREATNMTVEERFHIAIAILIILAIGAFWGGVIYIAWHFISKFW